jgi:hypothetical protein
MPAAAASGVQRPMVTKKDTAKIPLESAKPRVEAAAPVALASAAPAPGGEPPAALRITKPGDTAQITSLPKPSDVAASAEKRKTSRISLDAVLGESAAGPEASGPKTIRLKRPGEAPTVKVGAAPKPEPAAGAAEPPPAAGQTQRKTVVVRRPQASAASRKLSVARPTGAAPSEAPGVALEPAEPPKSPHWFFGLTAIAATLVLCVVIWMFAAQAIGPNSSMLQYSNWPTGPDLAWPGKTAWSP